MRKVTTLSLVIISLFVLLHINRRLPASAQALDCPELVKQALKQVQTACATVPRNKLCFGSSTANVELNDAAQTVQFSKPGDTVALADLKQITVNPYDAASNTWGAVLMRLQANLPDTAPGQAVTMLLMGDVAFGPDNKVTASGKGSTAYYFKTGAGAPACKGMPTSGILLESPQGKQRVQMTLNGVQLDIGSKVFIAIDKSAPKKVMRVYTLKGLVNVNAKGKTVSAADNNAVGIPIGDDDYYDEEEIYEETGDSDIPPDFEDIPVSLIDDVEAEYDALYPEDTATEPVPEDPTEVAPPDGSPEGTAAGDETLEPNTETAPEEPTMTDGDPEANVDETTPPGNGVDSPEPEPEP